MMVSRGVTDAPGSPTGGATTRDEDRSGEDGPPDQGRAAPTSPKYQRGSKVTTVPVWAAWMIVCEP